MIGVRLEVGVKEFPACGPDASAWWLDGHKNRVDFRQNARVIELQDPALLFLVVHIEDAQALGWSLDQPAGPPNLEGAISLCSTLIAQVKGVKDQ